MSCCWHNTACCCISCCSAALCAVTISCQHKVSKVFSLAGRTGIGRTVWRCVLSRWSIRRCIVWSAAVFCVGCILRRIRRFRAAIVCRNFFCICCRFLRTVAFISCISIFCLSCCRCLSRFCRSFLCCTFLLCLFHQLWNAAVSAVYLCHQCACLILTCTDLVYIGTDIIAGSGYQILNFLLFGAFFCQKIADRSRFFFHLCLLGFNCFLCFFIFLKHISVICRNRCDVVCFV